jgi:DNA repair exonuclease SbcCD ATPase subunit
MECQDRGFAPSATIADFGTGIRAGQARAMPNVPCRGDIFHALHEITPVVTFLENRAYDTIAAHDKLQHKKVKLQQQGRRDQRGQVQELARKVSAAAREQAKAIPLADEVALLARWLRTEVFAVSGLPYADRCMLFDFLVGEWKARVPQCPHRLQPVCTLLQNHRDQLLAFALQLDEDLAQLAAEFEVPVAIVREMLDVQKLDQRPAQRWPREGALRDQLRSRFDSLDQRVRALSEQVVRASSIIENLNSRLRNYFFLRREIGSGYLELLQFFLNHRRFLRSERPERADKSPAELLTGQAHPHWLEMLGHRRTCQN